MALRRGSATLSGTRAARIDYAHQAYRALAIGRASSRNATAGAKATTRYGLKASAGRIALARKLLCAKIASNSAVAIAAGGVGTSPPTAFACRATSVSGLGWLTL